MKALRRVFTIGLCTLVGGGTMLAAGSAAPAATAGVDRAMDGGTFSPKLMVNHSGKCLDVAVASQADGAFVQQWHCYNAPDNQTWNFVAVGDNDLTDGYLADGYYTLRAKHSGKCLEVAGGSTADSAQVYQMTCATDNLRTYQQWKLVQRSDGFFGLVARHSGKCLTVPGGNLNDGVGVIQETCDDDKPYQEWKLL
ncbi:RICIN domain-containing protein [Streptomyces sp. NPDC007264]|uniref:RICIN domain-containing protein n=1 Tax=Streptomyces sp. NPDC007264 TaxID=3364777 RepID=UPI0036DE1986